MTQPHLLCVHAVSLVEVRDDQGAGDEGAALETAATQGRHERDQQCSKKGSLAKHKFNTCVLITKNKF